MKLKLYSFFFPHDKKVDHFKSLDGLRGLAVLLVILSHASNENVYLLNFFDFSREGKIGVYLFFVLSAYLLDRQIMVALTTSGSSWRYWRYYAIRRFLRIYPLFAVALLIHFILTLTVIKTVIDHPADIVLHLLLLKGENYFWSIPVEFKYYFLSPLIMLFCHYILKWKPLPTFIFILSLIFLAMLGQMFFKMSEINTLRYLPIFLTGTLISIFEVILKPTVFFEKHRKKVDFFGLVALVVIIITIPSFFQWLTKKDINFIHYSFYLPYSILWAIILAAAKYGSGWITYIFNSLFLRYIGIISFSMYLFHKPILNLVNSNTLISEGLKFPLFLVLSVIFATLTYAIIERPVALIKLKK